MIDDKDNKERYYEAYSPNYCNNAMVKYVK